MDVGMAESRVFSWSNNYQKQKEKQAVHMTKGRHSIAESYDVH